jgi:hypothetical protein
MHEVYVKKNKSSFVSNELHVVHIAAEFINNNKGMR